MSKIKNELAERSQKKTRVVKTYPIHLVVIDTGDFGYDACGRCGLEVKDSPSRCPHCRASLEGTYVPPYPGGSDF